MQLKAMNLPEIDIDAPEYANNLHEKLADGGSALSRPIFTRLSNCSRGIKRARQQASRSVQHAGEKGVVARTAIIEFPDGIERRGNLPSQPLFGGDQALI